MKRHLLLMAILTLSTALFSCKKSEDTTAATSMSDEIGQNVGDVMAGVDESGGTTGSIATNEMTNEFFGTPKKMFSKALARSKASLVAQTGLLLPQATATSCFGQGFGACSGTSVTRSFSGCTVGLATFNGSVSLTWAGTGVSTCVLVSAGDNKITRNPNFSITGPAGYTYTVSKSGTNGQVLTWASGAGANKVFNFSNDGIRRLVTDSHGATIYDFTTQTTSDITVSGIARSNRVMNGGTLRITNNSTAVTCDISPSNVTWSSSCTCATSGSWSGTCSDSSSFSLSISSCGSGTLSVGSSSTSISFDRCSGS